MSAVGKKDFDNEGKGGLDTCRNSGEERSLESTMGGPSHNERERSSEFFFFCFCFISSLHQGVSTFSSFLSLLLSSRSGYEELLSLTSLLDL